MSEIDLEELNVEEIVEKIKNMEIRGAALIGRAGATALKKAVNQYEGSDLEDFRSYIDEQKERILKTRPTAVTLYNALDHVLKGDIDDIEGAKERIAEKADDFVERSNEAAEKIAEYGGKRINDGDTVLTHCNSSLALGAIKYAWDNGKEIEVIATESRPKRQGYITVRELARHGIPVTLIVDSAVRYFMPMIDQVYIGADTIASNGAVINKIGTSQVALCAHESRVPVTICAETYKFSRETAFGELVEIEERNPQEIADPDDFPGVDIRNPVFDATPEDYIDSIVTEEGIISPSSAYRIIKEME